MRVELESAYSKIRFLELEIFEEANAKMDRISNENLYIYIYNQYIYIYIGYIIVRDESLKKKKKRDSCTFLGHLSFWVCGMESPLIFLYTKEKKILITKYMTE